MPHDPPEHVAVESSAGAAEDPPATGRQAAWNYLIFALSKGSTLLMTVVVARMLDPNEFGLFALALLVVNLFDYVKDLGVAAALVQNRRDWDVIAPTGLTLSAVFGVVASGLLAGTAQFSARALGHPELVGFIRVLAIALAISALSTVPAARLRRSMNFSARLAPEALGALTKTGLTIGLAAAGFGVWSLVYGQLAATIVMTVLYWWVGRTRPKLALDAAVGRELIRFGIPVTAVTLMAYAIYNVDYLAVGTRLGATELGLYTLAYRIPELLVLNLCIVVSEVLFSALSGLQSDREALTRHYVEALAVVVALTAPIGVGLAVAAPSLVATLYGEKYAGSAAILSVLALYTVVYSASFHAGDVFKAIGRPGILTAINAVKLAVLVGPVWWAAGHDVILVAYALLGTELLHFFARMVVLNRVTRVRWSAIGGAVLRPLCAAVPMGLVLLCLGRVTGRLPAPAELALLIVAGMATYCALLRFTAPQMTAAAVAMLRRRLSRNSATSPGVAKEGS
ncbi:lipopolysaccharide biosynthesis protein [Mycobacterium hodleri]|uniref:Lipopolysaccharide biosynthesis protein n=1 Tax=Mycolicibacterium hodleri TaxID=49897 RepID=A0A502EAB7_9MYCO|nr:lipopolysaccharide biosynthesis protein [Mycolicibacterium hodleri]